jgi:hypothetical protein
MKRYLLLIWILCFLKVDCQPPTKFYRIIGGDGVDKGYSIKETPDYFYIVAGSTTSFGHGSSDAYIILLDTMGQIVWDRTFGGAGADVAKSIVFNPIDSGYIFAGYTNSMGSGGYDVFAARINKSGDLIWQQSYGGFDWDFGNDLIITSDGNIMVCGNSYNGPYPKNNGLILKINMTSGTQMWQKYYGGSEDDEFVKVSLTQDGYYSIVGNSASYGDIYSDFWLFKINQNGDSIRSKTFGTPNKNEEVFDFVEDNYHNLVFCGSYDTSAANSGRNVSYVVKTDLDGVFLLDAKFPGGFTDDDKFLSISNSRNADLYFVSRKVQNNANDIDIQPVIMIYSFVSILAKTHGEANDDIAFETSNTHDNGFIMAGYTLRDKQKNEDVYIIKLNNNLDSAEQVVGITTIKSQISNIIYFYNRKVYFNNPFEEIYSYEVINQYGIIVSKGTTTTQQVNLDPELIEGIYFIEIRGRMDQKLKFINE